MKQFEQAIQLIEKGDIEKGLIKLEDARKRADHEQLYDIAELYNELGLIDQASDIIQELRAFYPDEYELYVFEAELLLEQNYQEEAILLLEQIPEENSSFPQAQLLLADLYYLDGLDEVAEQKLLGAKKHAPKEPIIDFALAEFYLSQGNYHKCIPYYETILKTTPKLNEVVIALRIADVLSKTGKFEEALPFYEEGLKQKEDIDAQFAYGITALSANENKKAIQAFEEVKEMDDQYVTIYPYLAKAFEAEGATQEALQTCVAGISFDEYNEELYLQAAKLAIKMQKWKDGEEYLNHAVSLNPSHVEATLLLIGLLKDQERYEEMIQLIKDIQGFDEEVPEFYWYLATAYRKIENYNEALKQYETAYNYFTNDNEFLEEYAFFLIEEGKRKAARILLEKLLKNDPTLSHIEEILWDFDE